MKYMDYDLSQLPVVFGNVNPMDPTIDQYKKDMLDVNTKLLNEHSGMVWVFNFKHVRLVPSEHRILAGNWTKAHSQLLKDNVKATLMIECSMWATIVLKGMFLIAPSPIPMHVCRDAADAKRLMKEKYGVDWNIDLLPK